MLTTRELEALAKALAPAVAGVVKSLTARIDELERQVRDLPAPVDIDIDELVKSAASLVQIPSADDIAALVVIPEPIKGDPGKDAEPVDLESLAKAAAELVQIPEVRDGEPGLDGSSVSVDDLRPVIAELLDEAVKSLPEPAEPKHGEDGRDAIHLEILPAIDAEKSYARSTYAKHNGGLWRAFEKTSGMRGWECIVEGIAELSIEQAGERSFKALATLSSGSVTEKSLAIPAQIYRGVFKAGEYEPGDVVTWGGSAWHCEEATSDKPGEIASKGWTLAVKRGRDGKDGKNGIDKTAAVKLIPGAGYQPEPFDGPVAHPPRTR